MQLPLIVFSFYYPFIIILFLKKLVDSFRASGIGTNIPKGDIVYVNCINAQYLSDGVCITAKPHSKIC
jgi:hypothetical protein